MNNKKLELAIERFGNRFQKYNTYVLKELAKIIADFDGLNPSNARKLAQQLKYGEKLNEILYQLEKYSGISKEDIIVLLDDVAKKNVEFSKVYYEAKNIPYTSYEESKDFVRLVNAIKLSTGDTLENISKTTVFKLLDANQKPIYLDMKETYDEVIDRCVSVITTGQVDYKTAMLDTIQQLSESGVKKVYYDNDNKKAFAKRLDTVVMQNVQEGIKRVNIAIQEENGKKFGYDGIQIDAHSPCALDHLPIQGRRFTINEFDNLQNGDDFKDVDGNEYEAIDRSIGEWNCKHFIYPIIIDVSEPMYSEEQLEQMKQESLDLKEYNGMKMNKYDATQYQRKLETKIRQLQDKNEMLITSNADDNVIDSNLLKLDKTIQKYKDFSNAMNLDMRYERIRTYRKK